MKILLLLFMLILLLPIVVYATNYVDTLWVSNDTLTCNFYKTGCTSGYQCLDEHTPGDADFIYEGYPDGHEQKWVCNFPTDTIGTTGKIIDSVSQVSRFEYACPVDYPLYYSGTSVMWLGRLIWDCEVSQWLEISRDTLTLTSSWSAYTKTRLTNPEGGDSWTWIAFFLPGTQRMVFRIKSIYRVQCWDGDLNDYPIMTQNRLSWFAQIIYSHSPVAGNNYNPRRSHLVKEFK